MTECFHTKVVTDMTIFLFSVSSCGVSVTIHIPDLLLPLIGIAPDFLLTATGLQTAD
jgi:hypothetical protein